MGDAGHVSHADDTVNEDENPVMQVRLMERYGMVQVQNMVAEHGFPDLGYFKSQRPWKTSRKPPKLQNPCTPERLSKSPENLDRLGQDRVA